MLKRSLLILLVLVLFLPAAPVQAEAPIYLVLTSRTAIYTVNGELQTILPVGAIIQVAWFGPATDLQRVNYQRSCTRPYHSGYLYALSSPEFVHDNPCGE